MKKALLVLLLAASLPAFSATAHWTGRSEYVFTVTGKRATKCWYDVYGTIYTKLFVAKDSDMFSPECPLTLEVE